MWMALIVFAITKMLMIKEKDVTVVDFWVVERYRKRDTTALVHVIQCGSWWMEYWYNFPGTTSVLPTSFFLPLHLLYTHPTSTPHLCRKLVIATHLLRYRYVQRCGMNRYIQYHVSVYTFSYHTVVPTSAYYLMVSTLCMNPQLLPISHGATLTYLPYCSVTKSFILLLPPMQSLRSESLTLLPSTLMSFHLTC